MEKKENNDTIWMLVKGWMTFRQVARAILVAIFALVILSLVGCPKEMDETRDAVLYTQSGESILCDIQIKGDVTSYPLKGYSLYDLEVSCNGVSFAFLGYDPEERQYDFSKNHPGEYHHPGHSQRCAGSRAGPCNSFSQNGRASGAFWFRRSWTLMRQWNWSAGQRKITPSMRSLSPGLRMGSKRAFSARKGGKP